MPLELPQRTRYALIALFLLGMFLFALNPLQDHDTFYHLKTGEYIVATKTIPHYDSFSFTASGARWVTHEWLAQVVMYLAYAAGGNAGVLFLVGLTAVATYGILLLLARMIGASLSAALLLLLPSMALTLDVWMARPHIFSYLLFASLLLVLERFRRTEQTRWLWGALGTVLLWANVHAGVVLGLVVFALYAAAEQAKALWPRLGDTVPPPARRQLAIFALLSIPVSLLNPNTYETLTYIARIRPATEALNIAEWLSILSYTNAWQASFFLAVVALVNVVLIWRCVVRRYAEEQMLTGITLGVSLLPFLAIRHVGLFHLAAFAPLALLISRAVWYERALRRLGPLAAAAALALVGGAIAVAGLMRFPGASANEAVLPVGAAEYVREKRLPGPIFNYLHDGGYLIWALWPEHRVFIDGRSEVYLGEPLRDFLAIARLEPGWEKLVDEKYRINLFLLPRNPLLSKSVKPLVLALPRRGFKPVYADDTSFVFVREKPLP